MMTDSSPDDAMPIVGLKTSNNNSDNDDGKKTASAIQHDIKEKLTEADRLIAFTDAVVAIASKFDISMCVMMLLLLFEHKVCVCSR